MGDHYVTRGYLQGWMRQERLWAHDRRTNRSFPTQSKSILNETAMYSPVLEQRLAGEIDDPGIQALRRLCEGRKLTDAERHIVARFLFVQWKRVPAGRERVLQRLPANAANVQQRLLADIDARAARDEISAEYAAEERARVEAVIENITHEDGIAIWRQAVPDETSTAVTDTIQSLNWILLRAPPDALLTCDHPVYFDERQGLAGAQAELTFPLSPTTALWATREPIPDGTVMLATEELVRELNRRTAHNSRRYVISSTNADWIRPFVAEGEWLLTRLAALVTAARPSAP
jgi:hypothetical protein